MIKEPEEGVHVTMHILSRRSAKELRDDKEIHALANKTFKSLMRPFKSRGRVAARLSLPEDMPVKWDVEIAARREGVDVYEGHIPIMVSVSGKPGLMEMLNPEAVEEITNTVFKEIRDIDPSRPFARALGYSTEGPAKFHMYLPHQVRVRGRANPEAPYGDGDGDGDGDGSQPPPVWVQGGWSKGCDSWPW
jgi:hypothetical protein